MRENNLLVLSIFSLAMLSFAGSGFSQEAKRASGQTAEPQSNLKVTKYKDWDVACEKSLVKNCIMLQIGKDESGNPVMEMRIRKLEKVKEAEGKKIVAIAEVLTPLGVLLIPGIELQIDEGDIYAAPYQTCIQTGCIVQEPLAEETLKVLKAGNKATISLIDAARQKEVKASISLAGFTKAYSNL